MNLIITIYLADLPLALARNAEPALIEQPLIVWEQRNEQARVIASDAPGVTRSITLRQARIRCPDAAVRQYDPRQMAELVAFLHATLDGYSPRIFALEGPPDVVYAADLGRLSRARAGRVAEQLRDHLLHATGVTPALALAAHTTIGMLAARTAAAGRIAIVAPGEESAWLAPRPIDLLSLEPALLERLHHLGLRTIGALAALPRDALEAQFGATGALLYHLARGDEIRPPPAEPGEPRITVGWRFAGSVADRRVIEGALQQIAARLAQRLQHNGQAARKIMLTVTDDNGTVHSARRVLAEPASNPATLAAICGALCDTLAPGVAIERITIVAIPARLHSIQQELFPTGPQAERCQQLLAHLAPRFAGQLFRARVSDPAARRLEQRVQWASWDAP